MYDERAFYPLSNDIKNHVHKSIASGTLSALYQENLKNKDRRMEGRKKTSRHFVFRPATEETEDSAEDIFNLSIKKNGRGDW